MCVFISSGKYLFRRTVDKSNITRRKQNTGYCRPASLNKSSFSLRLRVDKRALMPVIFEFCSKGNKDHQLHTKMFAGKISQNM